MDTRVTFSVLLSALPHRSCGVKMAESIHRRGVMKNVIITPYQWFLDPPLTMVPSITVTVSNDRHCISEIWEPVSAAIAKNNHQIYLNLSVQQWMNEHLSTVELHTSFLTIFHETGNRICPFHISRIDGAHHVNSNMKFKYQNLNKILVHPQSTIK